MPLSKTKALKLSDGSTIVDITLFGIPQMKFRVRGRKHKISHQMCSLTQLILLSNFVQAREHDSDRFRCLVVGPLFLDVTVESGKKPNLTHRFQFQVSDMLRFNPLHVLFWNAHGSTEPQWAMTF